jgi:hypothetical protein
MGMSHEKKKNTEHTKDDIEQYIGSMPFPLQNIVELIEKRQKSDKK